MLHLLGENPAPIDSDQMWMLFAMLMVGLIYFLLLRPMMRKKKDPLERGAGFSSLSQQRSTERHMQNLLVELSEMSRQITAQLDTRSAKLELLIKEADEKIAALQQAGDGTAAPRRGFAPERAEPREIEPPAEPEIDPRHAEVYTLADEGKSAVEIASALSRPRGEVELILALRTAPRSV